MGNININLKQLYVIDNFYSPEDFNFMVSASLLNPYDTTYQPNSNFMHRKENGYICHETKEFNKEDLAFNLFYRTFQEKTLLKVNFIRTHFRKIYSSDIPHVFKYGMSPHQDRIGTTGEINIAGVVHINASGLEDGTALFSSNEQIEPDIIIGAVPNRCVFYDPKIWHRPLQDKRTELRIIQPFFMKVDNYENNKRI